MAMSRETLEQLLKKNSTGELSRREQKKLERGTAALKSGKTRQGIKNQDILDKIKRKEKVDEFINAGKDARTDKVAEIRLPKEDHTSIPFFFGHRNQLSWVTSFRERFLNRKAV